MDFIDHLKNLGQKIERSRVNVATEEATKSAFVMPFIHALGYDVFDPLEVIPEFTADHGIKRGEKVDYAIQKNGSIVMLIECKCCTSNLDVKHASQLYRYFGVTDAKIGILTNGISYQVFTDLERPNTMDEQPFLTFDLLDLNEALVPEIKRLTKTHFDIQETMSAAVTLKYTQGIRRIIEKEFSDPSDDFVKHLAKEVYPGKRMGAQQIEEFAPIVKRAIQQYITDKVNARIVAALSDNQEASKEKEEAAEQAEPEEATEKRDVDTTEEERQGYAIVKAILRKVVDPERIAMRDTKSYCGVLLDDNNRKPICRLHFNRDQKYIGLFDQEKQEERITLQSVDDIYDYESRLIETLAFYDDSVDGDESGSEDDQVLTSEPVSNAVIVDADYHGNNSEGSESGSHG